jgi:hypothetical protein
MQIASGHFSDVDHDRLMAWIDHMKGVYQAVIDKHAKSGKMEPRDVVKARNHLQCLTLLEKAVREHHEAANGQLYPGGPTRPLRFNLETIATLILPDGTRKEIPRHG